MSGANVRRDASRSVFVGNIPYDATEEQLTEIFQEVGPVVSFRLVFDRETGKPKGYGFCEYRDSQTALSAMRNLNGYEMNGRPLRVYFAENEKGMEGFMGSNVPGGSTGPGNPPANWNTGTGMNTPASIGSATSPLQSEVTQVLEGMSPSQLYDIIVQMKGLIQKKPDQARQLLLNNPQFGYALLQAMVLNGALTPQAAQQLQPPREVPAANVPPAAFGGQPAFNPAIGLGVQGAGRGPNMAMAFNPMMAGHMAPAAIHAPSPAEQLGGALPEEQKQLLDKVMKLTPEQIEKLHPQEQFQINQLRQAMMRFYPQTQ